MIYLFLAVLCSTSIALILKYNHTKSGNEMIMISGNYFIASLIAGALLLFDANAAYSWATLLFGAALAIFYIIGFFVFAKAVSAAGTALSTVSSRVSVLIPVILSIIIYGETPDTFEIFGFVFGFATIILFYFSLRSNPAERMKIGDYFYLFALFMTIGMVDFALKLFNHQRPPEEKTFFVLTIFFFAFIYSLAVIFKQKNKFEARTFARGLLLGIPNVLSTIFILAALASLPAIIVYPVANISIILLTTVAAWLLWRERLNLFGFLSVIFGIISIVLLNI